MRDVLHELMSVWRAGGTAGVATVVRTMRSAPRQAGAAMVVAPDGTVAGSVSGGCVEAAVYELATEVVRTGHPQLQRYGITDDDAFAVGLTCGGIIDIFAEPLSQNTFPQLGTVADDIAAHRPTAVATVIAHPEPEWIGRRLVVGETSVEGSLGSARSTTRSPTTRAGCSPPDARPCSPTARTDSARAPAWRCSSRAMRLAPG